MRACGVGGVCPDLAPLIGPPVRQILGAALGIADGVQLDRLERAFRAAYDSDGWRLTRCMPGVRPMLEQLRRAGVSLSVVTNKPAHATGLILRELALDGCFREVVCRDGGCADGKAGMLTDLLDRQAIPRAECMMVGDTLEDWHAARAAGIECALVGQGTSNKETLVIQS